jgi:hypothetical protein
MAQAAAAASSAHRSSIAGTEVGGDSSADVGADVGAWVPLRRAAGALDEDSVESRAVNGGFLQSGHVVWSPSP